MKTYSTEYRRRTFLRWGLTLTAGLPLALAKVDPNKQFKWPGAKYPDGSIADY
jgi:hypothetical protein